VPPRKLAKLGFKPIESFIDEFDGVVNILHSTDTWDGHCWQATRCQIARP
jgi:hypothetical protein